MDKDIINVGKKEPSLIKEEQTKRQIILSKTFDEAFSDEDHEEDDI